jgi:hypothetical protein
MITISTVTMPIFSPWISRTISSGSGFPKPDPPALVPLGHPRKQVIVDERDLAPEA